MQPDYAVAKADIWNGLFAYQIWTHLAWQEVKRRYRRTIFGPFWATLSLGVFILAISFVWAPIFKVDITSYLPYLTTGLIAWTFTTAIINEGCGTFTGNESLIKQLNFPFMTFAFMLIWRNLIILLHHLVILLPIYIWQPSYLSLNTLLILPGLLILAANGAWIATLLGLASARFRDIPPLVANFVQVLMFITPIFWTIEQMGPSAAYFVYPNYLYHLVNLLRAPMLGGSPALFTYVVTILGAGIGWAITLMIYARFRRRIAYWL